MKILVAPSLNLTNLGPTITNDLAPVQLSAVLSEARHIACQYARIFAGKQRATRDVAWLVELAERLSVLLREVLTSPFSMQASGLVSSINHQLVLVAAEASQIRLAYGSGRPDERLGGVIDRINDLLVMYHVHFSGRPRLSRRASLLKRQIKSLSSAIDSLQDLERENVIDSRLPLGKERARVQLELLRSEVELITALQVGVDRDQRLEILWDEAQVIHSEFRTQFEGKSRKEADCRILGYLCDRMEDVEFQLIEISRGNDSPSGKKYLSSVQKLIDAYESEYQAVQSRRCAVVR